MSDRLIEIKKLRNVAWNQSADADIDMAIETLATYAYEQIEALEQRIAELEAREKVGLLVLGIAEKLCSEYDDKLVMLQKKSNGEWIAISGEHDYRSSYEAALRDSAESALAALSEKVNGV